MNKKIILTIGIIVLLLAGIYISAKVVSQIDSVSTQSIKKYIYEPVSAVDNRVDNGDKYLLPFIFETPEDRISKSYIESEFAKANLTIKSISTSKIGTGTIILTQEDTKPYQVLIYGDVNGDGKVGLADSQDIVEAYLNPDIAEKQLTGIYYTAGNVRNNDNRVNLVDAQRIVDFYLENETNLLSNPPVDDKITGIEVILSDVKLVYNYGEELDLTGAKVRRVTASGAKCVMENLPKNCVTGYNKNVAGEQTLTVSYKGYTTTFKVTVLKPVTSLIIDESCKTTDRSIGKQFVLGTIKQGEGQSSFDYKNLKTNVTLAGTNESTTAMVVTYKLRSEVFKNFTEQNKNDVIVLANSAQAGNYKVTAYLGQNFDKATAKSNVVNVKVTDTITINKIEIDGTLQLICKKDLTGVNIPSESIYTETKKVENQTETVHYTLLPVKFTDQYGNEQKLKLSDFAGYDESVANKITVSDNYGFEIPGVEVKLFRKDADEHIVEAGGENTFDYIGFAPIHNGEYNESDNRIVTITYGLDTLVDAVQANIQVKIIK